LSPWKESKGKTGGRKDRRKIETGLFGRQPSGLESGEPGQSKVKQTHLVTCAE